MVQDHEPHHADADVGAPADEFVVVSLTSANRDADVWGPTADDFDVQVLEPEKAEPGTSISPRPRRTAAYLSSIAPNTFISSANRARISSHFSSNGPPRFAISFTSRSAS